MNDTPKQLTNTQHYWAKQSSMWESSGLTQPAFCKQHGIKYATFAKWRQRLKRRRVNKANDGQPTMLPLTISKPSATMKAQHERICITSNNGCCVELPLSIHPQQLQLILKHLRVSDA